MTSEESMSQPELPRPRESAEVTPSDALPRPRPITEVPPETLPSPPRAPIREWFTFVIALALVGAFVVIIGAIVLAWIFKAGVSADDIVKVLTTVSGIMAGLVGAVTGYYFRGRVEAARRGEE